MPQLAIDLEQRVLRPIQQDQSLRAEAHRLPADFRADASAGAGNQDHFACDESLQFGGVEIDRLAAEQFRQFDRLMLLARPPGRPQARNRRRQPGTKSVESAAHDSLYRLGTSRRLKTFSDVLIMPTCSNA